MPNPNDPNFGKPDEAQRFPTKGELAVRLDFNPSQEGVVYDIKRHSAALIDLCEKLKAKDPRLASLAQTAYEEAAIWAVKAATALKA